MQGTKRELRAGAKGFEPRLDQAKYRLLACSLRLIPVYSRSLPAVLISGLDGVKIARGSTEYQSGLRIIGNHPRFPRAGPAVSCSGDARSTGVAEALSAERRLLEPLPVGTTLKYLGVPIRPRACSGDSDAFTIDDNDPNPGCRPMTDCGDWNRPRGRFVRRGTTSLIRLLRNRRLAGMVDHRTDRSERLWAMSNGSAAAIRGARGDWAATHREMYLRWAVAGRRHGHHRCRWPRI